MTKQFPVIYEWAGKNFSGFAPDVPGCAATARTIAKMRLELKSALEAHLQWMNDDGNKLPEPSASVTVDLNEDPEFPNPPGYYVIVDQIEVAVPDGVSTTISKNSKRELTAA